MTGLSEAPTAPHFSSAHTKMKCYFSNLLDYLQILQNDNNYHNFTEQNVKCYFYY